jgi:hypothetical protein
MRPQDYAEQKGYEAAKATVGQLNIGRDCPYQTNRGGFKQAWHDGFTGYWLQAIAIWNLKYPPGTPVNVLKDDGSIFETRTTSEAILRYSTPFIFVEGIAGGYHMARISV